MFELLPSLPLLDLFATSERDHLAYTVLILYHKKVGFVKSYRIFLRKEGHSVCPSTTHYPPDTPRDN